MKWLGIILGIISVLVLFSSAPVYLCLIPALLGALLFAVGARRDRDANEERRHQEMVEATGGK